MTNRHEEHVVRTPRGRLSRTITLGVLTLGALVPVAAAAAASPLPTSTTTTAKPTTTSTTSPAPAVVTPQLTSVRTTRLTPGASLSRGNQLTSPAGNYWLAMQTDGNLVFYNSHGPLWSSGTSNTAASHLVMQTDGNLVLYTNTNVALWSSGTVNFTSLSLTITNQGAFSLLTPGNIAVWTNGHGTGLSETQLTVGETLSAGQALVATNGEQLSMQADGNLVVYGPHGALWQAGTAHSGSTYLVVQTDGNVVLYAPGNRPTWSAQTNNLPVSVAEITTAGQFVITGPEGPLWQNGSQIIQMPSTVGVYAYPDPQSTPIAQGWPILGDTGALGTCGGANTGLYYAPHNGADERVGFAIQNSTKNVPWLSFWTVSGPTTMVKGQCVPAADTSPKAFYKVGVAAGRFVARAIDAYAADGLHLKPTDVILDPEGLPDNHSFLDQGINDPAGPTGGQIYRWTQMLAGWTDGLHSVDQSLKPAVYADQAEYVTYHLSALPIDAFLAVAFGYAPGQAYPVVNPARLPGANGANIKGVIAFFAGVPDAVACRDVRFEAKALASWGAPLNTLQFDPGTTCQP